MSSTLQSDILWRPETDLEPFHGDGKAIFKPELFDVIDSTIETLSKELRELSLDIHGELNILMTVCIHPNDMCICSVDHPELKWEEQCVIFLYSIFCTAQVLIYSTSTLL